MYFAGDKGASAVGAEGSAQRGWVSGAAIQRVVKTAACASDGQRFRAQEEGRANEA